jgi:peptide/nickel transport system ATP-binding protein
MSADSRPLLEIRDLRKHFLVLKKGREKSVFLKAVDGISLDLYGGEVLGLVGESGSGKSTVAYTVVGMYKPSSGSILFEGREIGVKAEARPREIKRELQIVFQDPSTSLNPRRSIGRILERPLKVHGLATRRSMESEVEKLLELVELPPHFMYKNPPAIGGGERQLVSIARAIATRPKLLILDEPTSALDVSVQGKIINTLTRLRRELGLSYLFITHDLSLMRNVSDRVAIMYLGKICEIADTQSFFEKPLHPYTKMLLSSIPVVSREEEKVRPEKIRSRGEIPSPVNVPPGCSFHTRCLHAMVVCRREDPGFVDAGYGDAVGGETVSGGAPLGRSAGEHLVRCHLYR